MEQLDFGRYRDMADSLDGLKRRTRPIPGVKSLRYARILLGGIEVMHMIIKEQMKCVRGTHPATADQVYGLVT